MTNRREVVLVLQTLMKNAESSEMLLPKVFPDVDKTTDQIAKYDFRLRMGKLLSWMVQCGWIQPVTINERTTYEITAAGRKEYTQRTAN